MNLNIKFHFPISTKHTQFAKGYHSPLVLRTPFQNHPPITRIPPFLKIPHLPTLLANRSSQVFLINRNATVKLSLINTIHVKLFYKENLVDNVYICDLLREKRPIAVKHCFKMRLTAFSLQTLCNIFTSVK